MQAFARMLSKGAASDSMEAWFATKFAKAAVKHAGEEVYKSDAEDDRAAAPKEGDVPKSEEAAEQAASAESAKPAEEDLASAEKAQVESEAANALAEEPVTAAEEPLAPAETANPPEKRGPCISRKSPGTIRTSWCRGRRAPSSRFCSGMGSGPCISRRGRRVNMSKRCTSTH